jgi:hypothetical protein
MVKYTPDLIWSDTMDLDEDTISETAPSYSPSKVLSTIRRRGVVGSLEDPEQGPHVHLTLLLATVFLVSFLIILITQFAL